MDINEIAKNVNEGIGLGIATFAAYWGLQAIANVSCALYNLNEGLRTKEEIDSALAEECRNLSLNPEKFKVRFTTPDDGDGWLMGFVKPEENGDYLIGMNKKFGCNRSTLKHELAHIANGDDKHGFLHYVFFGEPKAILYGTFGVRV